MMQEPMKLAVARSIAQDLARAYKKFGKQLVSPYHLVSLYEAISVLEREGRWDCPTKDELVKLRRQLGAANARVTKLARKAGVPIPTDDEEVTE